MDILCIGDSLVYGYGVGRPHVWTALAAEATGHAFINRGVNGATTGEMLKSFLACSEKADALLVLCGLNDLFMGMPVETPLRHIRAVFQAAQARGMAPAAAVFMPPMADVDEAWCEGPVDMDTVRAAGAEYAERLLAQCREDGVPAIDFRTALSDPSFYRDGIHLNRRGHEVMAGIVAAHYGKE